MIRLYLKSIYDHLRDFFKRWYLINKSYLSEFLRRWYLINKIYLTKEYYETDNFVVVNLYHIMFKRNFKEIYLRAYRSYLKKKRIFYRSPSSNG